MRRGPAPRRSPIVAGGGRTSWRDSSAAELGLDLSLPILRYRLECLASEPWRGARRLLQSWNRSAVTPGDAIITFNYDTAGETALRRAGKWSVGDGYGFTVLDQPELRSPVRVLKLHGSTNWNAVLFGGRRKGVFTTPNALGDRPGIPPAELRALGYQDLRDPLCPDDEAPHAFTMIPPVTRKEFFFRTSDGREFEPFFDDLWEQAGQALQQATAVFILGYSMPTADERARDLLLRANARARVTIASGGDTERLVGVFRTAGFGDVRASLLRFEDWDWTSIDAARP